MYRILTFFCVFLISLSTQAQGQKSRLTVTEHQLSNGMSVWFNEDHSQPKVYGAVVVKAGAKDCPGTGIAHYFEHILFKGTDRIGTVDYASEKVFLDSISAQYELLSKADDKQRIEIQSTINRLSRKAADYAIPNEFNRLITRYGGSGLNAGTSRDMTYYYNTFPSQYLEQWALLYSERLINPVFRLFQSELETVYEEKNRSSDNALNGVLETVMNTIFGEEPYGFPVIGTTENLKNPSLTEMDKFFKTYYVGCNMGIVMSGDFNSEEALPILERTFGRIERGTGPVRKTSPIPAFSGVKMSELKAPIPLISASGNIYKAPTDYEPDARYLDMGLKLLSNGSSGLLDSLMNESKLLAGIGMRMALNDAGLAGIVVIPNLLSSSSKAEAKVMEQVERIKNGDFSNEMFNAVKFDAIRNAETNLETIDDRADMMVTVMASGHSWEDYMNLISGLRSVTRDDVTTAMRKYFGNDFYHFRKKYGKNKSDKLKQPGYKPVKPKHIDEESDFARQLAQIPTKAEEIKSVNFTEDVKESKITPHVTLYISPNPVNDQFELKIRYKMGYEHDSRLSNLVTYMNKIGTDSLTRQQWQRSLYVLGINCSMECTANHFNITLNGPDSNINEALRLTGHLLTRAKHEESALKDVVDDVRMEAKSFGEDNKEVVRAIIAKVRFGIHSKYLNLLTPKEAKMLKGNDLLGLLNNLLTNDCCITYTGTLTADELGEAIKKHLPIDRCVNPSQYITYATEVVNEPLVYIYNMPSRQTYICTYESVAPQKGFEDKIRFDLLNEYLGGSMSSVLFQELREFRSMCYNTQSSNNYMSHVKYPDKPMSLVTITSTQADKTNDVQQLLDSLITDMPFRINNFEASRQGYISELRNNFPSFREMPDYVYGSQLNGYDSDPSTLKVKAAENISMKDVIDFYKKELQSNGKHRCYMIVGNKKHLDMKALAKYGRIVELKKQDLIHL